MSGLIIGLYAVKDNMPPILFNTVFIFFIVCLVLLLLILIFSIIRFVVEWNRSLQFVDNWYCNYNTKARHIEIHGNIDLAQSSFSKLRGAITQNDVTYWLSPEPINHHMLLQGRYAISFKKDDVSIRPDEPITIQVDVWLKNLRKKSYSACHSVTSVGGN